MHGFQVMTPGATKPDDSARLRREEAEFYEVVVALVAETPPGTTIAEALGTPAGQRLRKNWQLRYGSRRCNSER